MTTNDTVIEIRHGLIIGVCAHGGPTCYPLRPYFIELPGGMRHHFATLEAARARMLGQ